MSHTTRPTTQGDGRPLAQPALGAALAAASALLAALGAGCGDDESRASTTGQGGGQGGAASTATSSTATGMGGAGGAPTCTEDPSLCSGPTPVCHEGSCVECAPGSDALCGGETPYCDAQTLSCVPCRYHAHCPDSACNPFTGACLSATPQTVGPGGDYPSIVEAITNGVGSGEEAVFLVSAWALGKNDPPVLRKSDPGSGSCGSLCSVKPVLVVPVS